MTTKTKTELHHITHLVLWRMMNSDILRPLVISHCLGAMLDSGMKGSPPGISVDCFRRRICILRLAQITQPSQVEGVRDAGKGALRV